MRRMAEIREVSGWSDGDLAAMSALLVDVVEEGASLGFLPPLSRREARAYWLGALAESVKLWVAEHDGHIVGTVQLQLSAKPNGRHRAEIAKLMVHPQARRLGIARQLLETAETAGRHEGISLMVLDTREGDPSNVLYRSLGYHEVGRIPQYARSADGTLHTTVLYYKVL